MFPLSAKKREKCKIFSGSFVQIFHKCETAHNSDAFFFLRSEGVSGAATFFFSGNHRFGGSAVSQSLTYGVSLRLQDTLAHFPILIQKVKA